LQISVENIGEKRGLLLLLLATAEKEIEQAFGRAHLGRQSHEANYGGSNEHAAQPALKKQFGTQKLAPPDGTDLPCGTRGALQGSHSPSSWMAKCALIWAEKGKERDQRHGKRHIFCSLCPAPEPVILR